MPSLNDSFLSFLKRLDPPGDVVDHINQVKNIIQKHLSQQLEAFALSKAGGQAKVTPRFFIQGSWAYDTLNLPYQAPPQNMDIDLGVYLPVSYLENERPSVAARAFFDQVDFLLGELAERNKWQVNRTKKTCTCLVLNDSVHIDVPLYSIPDDDFRGLATTAHKRGLIKDVGKFSYKTVEGNMDLWAELPSSNVLLARREGHWQKSDPRMIHRWFVEKVLHKGVQLRRVCRYLKAWRDKLWLNGGPSSLFLMVLCSQVFKADAGRDDLALLKVLRQMPETLDAPVLIPEIIPANLSELQKPEDLKILKKEALLFSRDLAAAISSNDGGAVDAERSLASHLGARFPVS